MACVSIKLSALDLIPVRTDQTTADALTATVGVARAADAAGFTRYWVAEHHNMPAVGATSPPVVISHLAARTDRIRIGSGGVMLPNHAPLAVAEQFALLEAAYPGRIDLGIGRAPGSDPVTAMALRGPASQGNKDLENFPDYVDEVISLMSPDGVQIPMHGGQTYHLHGTPSPVSEPTVWLLGSSGYSAQLAAAKGLPYVFAHHFSGEGTAAALGAYRSSFKPSEYSSEPQTFLTVNAVVADTQEEADARALPQLQSMAKLRSGKLEPLALIEDAAAADLDPRLNEMIAVMRRRWLIGTPSAVAKQLTELAASFDVDEVMINPVGSAHRGESARTATAREETITALAAEVA
ncbi:LLM class flavin-dependent oxidoreductase [Spelaeicoccus albus]